MRNIRLLVTLFLVIALALLSLFQMQIRGYEKITRINPQAVLYMNEDDCNQDLSILFEDQTQEYYMRCIEQYIIKSGFQERTLPSALEDEIITIEELEEILEIETIPKD